MADKNLYVLAGLDDASSEYLDGLQQKLYEAGFVGTHTKNIPAHITLGMYPCNEEEALKLRMKDIADRRRPVDISYSHMGIFGRGGHVLFAAPDISEELLGLKEEFGPGDDWTPHSTLLIDENDAVAKAVALLSGDFSEFRGRIDKLYLYEFFPTRFICRYDLGGTND